MHLSVDGPTARARAKSLIKGIFEEHGNIDEETLEEMGKHNSRWREKVEFAQRKSQEIAASALRTLATQLYSDPSRFIFEVLQNAEDNHYSHAREQGENPYISFKVYRDRIIIECNEDGFDEKNVKAICGLGNSSKRDTRGYIGAKGIGFKSVFLAAWKVHIQSGYYSFYFKYRKGGNELGMVSPIWEDPDPVQNLPLHMTRMTLFLHDEGDTESLSSKRRKIEQQFDRLDQSLLLFMRNLKEIRISIFGSNNKEQRSATYSVSSMDGGRATLTTRISKGRKITTTSYAYHVTRLTVYDLPEHDDRQQQGQEGQSEVILAFPLGEHSTPIIKHQNVYAFLPVRPMGFSFLIQGDFVTQANRQDIVEGSTRNEKIVEHIGLAFIQAVLKFCEHPILRYTWMRFLPEQEYPYSGLWQDLVHMIEKNLEAEAVLLPRTESRLCKIEDLRAPHRSYCDAKGDPLFRDLQPEMWMSRRYGADDIEILQAWGLQDFRNQELLKMVRQELSLPDSHMKSEQTDDNWHTRAATMLLAMASQPKALDTLRRLDLVPCRDNPTCWTSWKSVTDSNSMISLAESKDGVPVPEDLRVQVITSKASKNPKRVAFFERLGLKFASTRELRSSVFLRHQHYQDLSNHASVPDVQVIVDQSKFLYLTQHTDPEQQKGRNEIALMDETCAFWFACDGGPLYLSDDHPYGPRELLKITESGGISNAKGHRVAARFLNPCFLSDPPEKPAHDSETWLGWLQSYAGVRSSLRLTDPSQFELSPECYHVAQYRPERFLGLLRHQWRIGEMETTEWRIIGQQLKDLKVLCHGNRMVSCSETYLPLSDLQEMCCKFLTEDHEFPFLEINEGEGDLARETYTALNWDFLVEFAGVRVEKDLAFFLAILDELRESESDLGAGIHVVQLYSMIYTKYADVRFDNRKAQQEQIKRAFEDEESIYTLGDDELGYEAVWDLPRHCRWDGPPQAVTFHSLSPSYKAVCADMKVELNNVERLFCDVLGIRSYVPEDVVQDLNHLKNDNGVELGTVVELYKYLSSLTHDMNKKQRQGLRERFDLDRLIYVPPGRDGQHQWHSIQGCLWSSKTKIGSKAMLEEHYNQVNSFMVDFLGVGTLTLSVVHDELIRLGSSKGISADDTRDQIISLNSFLMETKASEYPSAFKLAKLNILPVRGVDGTVSLASSKSAFVIVDRIQLGEIFANQVRTLDFSFDEVCRLKSFIEFLGIGEKRLSETVKERTEVNEDDIQPLLRTDRQIGPKAFALCRVALHFGSPRLKSGDSALYKMLREAQVYTTEGIFSELELYQGANIKPLKAKVPSDLHIREKDGQLEVFVSKHKKKQDFSYSSKLNLHLLRWLMTDIKTGLSDVSDPKGLLIVQKILNSRRSVLEQVLEEEGIVTGSIEDPDQDMQSDAYSESEISSDGENATQPVHVSLNPCNNDSGDGNEADLRYGKALRGIVVAAQSSRFPNHGSFNVSAIPSALMEDDTSHSRDGHIGDYYHAFDDDSPLERDKKIGAAGELYVYELLRTLGLPNFTIDQWQSKIRHYAAAHPEYADIMRWEGEETSDLTYHDSRRRFTKLLINTGYLDGAWRNRRPVYFLEVKTTLGPCNKPFFLSRQQYDRMNEHKTSTDNVYLVFRVYQIGCGNIGLKIFLNPTILEDEGQLIFTTHTWSVVGQ